MCGIAGFSITNKTYNHKVILEKMNDKLSHRGPDGQGFFHDHQVSLAHKRLAIIDLNPRSDQPFFDITKNYILVFNGEIYNYLELKDELVKEGFVFNTAGDTEVLLNAYIFWGKEMLHKIKGMFSFAIYDKKKSIVFCARDHFGQKPFFYYYESGNFIFSSELRSLISNPAIKKIICKNSIIEYLHYDSFVNGKTPLENCYKLQPSEYLIFDLQDRKLTKEKYWLLNIKNKKDNDKYAHDKFIGLLKKSTEMNLRSDVPLALYLSGGIDSTSLGLISKNVLSKQNVHAFNLKFKNNTYNENEIATDTAKKLNIKLKSFDVEETNFIEEVDNAINNLDEPLADLGYLAVFLIAKYVSKEGYKVAISGDGGDELLMGYEPFQRYWLIKILNSNKLLSKSVKSISNILKDDFSYMGLFHKIKIFSKSLGHPSKHYNSRWIGSFMPEEIDKVTSFTDFSKKNLNCNEVLSYIESIIDQNESKNEYDLLSIQYQKHFLSNLICSHTDKANMHHSIEARSPFLDHELFDYVNSLPKDFKMNSKYSKLPLRKYLKENLRSDVYKKAKQGFTVPMANWISKELKKMMLETINKDNVKNLEFLNISYILEKIIKPHLNGDQNNYKKIWNIFVLIRWVNNNISN